MDIKQTSKNQARSPQQLPTFQEYTIDYRLEEFRKVNYETQEIEFIPFNSEKGKALLFALRLKNSENI